MKVDRVEFGDALASKRSFWTEENDERLHQTSLLRRIGVRVEDHIGPYPVIPCEHGTYVISSGVNGVMAKMRADKNGCVVCGMTDLRTIGINSLSVEIPLVENIFLTNILSVIEMDTSHLDSVQAITSIMPAEGTPRPPDLLASKRVIDLIMSTGISHILDMPDNNVLLNLGGEEYHLHELTVPDSHRRCLRYEGYLLGHGALCYDASPIVTSDDGHFASWSIGLIISDPCHLRRFSVPIPD